MLQIKFNVHIYKSCADDASTIVGPTNIRRYKGWTVQTLNLQTSDWYKRRTDTNVGPVQTLPGYIYKEKRWTLVEFEKILLL